ncbi:putative nuclease HARBI1 [Ixodes scapularis]
MSRWSSVKLTEGLAEGLRKNNNKGIAVHALFRSSKHGTRSVCDANMRILAVEPSMPGCSHDALVWRQSWVRQQCIAGRLIRHGEYLLGDSGYPLEPWLMTPVPGRPAVSTPAGRYNAAHASMRSVVERCIGLLKSRFRCVQKHRVLYHHPRIAGTIVAACAVLHKICLSAGESDPGSSSSKSESSSGSDDDSEADESSDTARERRILQSRRLYIEGKAMQDQLVLGATTSHVRRVHRRLHQIRHPGRHQ